MKTNLGGYARKTGKTTGKESQHTPRVKQAGLRWETLLKCPTLGVSL